MKKDMLTTFFLCCAALTGCGGDKPSNELQPALKLEVFSTGATSAVLEVKTVNADFVRVMCVATQDPAAKTADEVFANGEKHSGTRIEIDGLSSRTTYTAFVVACDSRGKHSAMNTVRFTTEGSDAEMYAWEKARKGILSFTDMVLCYGGSRHRVPSRWDKGRFEPFVTYVDEEGHEKWLFDSFLCIEFVTTASVADGQRYSYMVGVQGTSAGKAQWEELIDYWFDGDNGVGGLEKAVEAASARLGAPKTKRKVIMTMPDPIIYQQYADKKSPTAYWGKLDGKTMDFSSSEDRVAVYKWYINQVRKKFNDANYKNIELAGFYIISEELTSPGDGWNPELKKSDEIIPPVSKYLNSINHALCWIPYNRAAGYKKWKQFGVNYAYMQPNRFWDTAGTKPMSRFFSDIKANGLAMELEFDWEMLDGKPNCESYRARFREYLTGAKSNGVYGTVPLSYYQGDNVLYDLWKSGAEEDKKIFHEFCQFVTGNPLRE